MKFLIRNILLLIATMCIGIIAIVFFQKARLTILSIVTFIVAAFFITFAVKNILTILFAMVIKKIEKKKN